MFSKHRQEKIFGLVVAAITTTIGLWQLAEPIRLAWPWFMVALGLTLISLLWPVFFRPAYRGWMVLGHWLGILNTQLLLAIVFFIFITPIALFFRLTGRDALHLKQQQIRSYWIKRDKPWSPDSFKNQF